MIYFIYGEPNKTHEKVAKMTESLLLKKPDAALFKIRSENFAPAKMEEMIGGQTLFANKYIVVLSRLLEIKEQKEYLFSKIKEIKESENIFFWIEEKVAVPDLKKIQTNAEKVISFTKKPVAENRNTEVFKLAEYFAKGDKKNAWLLFQKVKKTGRPEEIYGTLWWQVKSLLIAKKTYNAKEANMKDFTYRKVKQISDKYTESKLSEMAFELINIYHKSRENSEDLELNLEKLILE